MSQARSIRRPMTKRPLKVMVVIITLWSFLFNTVLCDVTWAAKSTVGSTSLGPTGTGGSGIFKELNVDTFSLPEYLGHIKDSCKGNASKKVVIHIQDAHCNYAAQHKIADIVEYLHKEYGIDTINLEGGKGEYDLSIFTRIYDKGIREKVSDYFVKEGLVNGAEYFAINNPDKAYLWGVEDTDLYIKNLNIYRESLKHKEDVEKYLKELDHIVSNLKRHIYNLELLELDQKYTEYKIDKLEFKDYLTYLIKKAQLKAIDIKTLTNIYLLHQSLNQENDIDFKVANNERNSLIDRFEKMFSKKAIEELIQKTVEFKAEQISQKDYYAYLVKKANQMNLDLKNYPELQKYIVYISTYEAIDKAKIMEELTALETKLKESMFEIDDQRTLDTLSKNLILTKNIFNISISREDWEYYKENEKSFDIQNYTSFIDKKVPMYRITAKLDNNIDTLDRYRKDISEFYDYSFKRDKVFLSNIKPANATLLITGGFHTENLCELFKKKGISYISIMPNFKNGNGYESPYFSLLAGKECGLQKELYPIISSASSMQIASWLSEALGSEVWDRRNLNTFKAAVFVQEEIAKGNKVKNIRKDGNNIVFEIETSDGKKGEISKSLNQFIDDLHEAQIDRLLANAYENGRFEDLDEKHKDMRSNAAQRIRDLIPLVQDKGKQEALEALAKEIESGEVNINLVDVGNASFEGHAGGMGIHVNARIKNDRIVDVIVHEAIAGLVGDHLVADAVEQNKLTLAASMIDSRNLVFLPGGIWNVGQKADRITLAQRRDFAMAHQAPPDSMRPVPDDIRKAVSFTNLVSALRNHIGKAGSAFYENIKGRILKGEQAVTNRDRIGNVGQVNTLGTFIDEHFALPEEAVREIITNAYDSMHSEPVAERREVQIRLRDKFLSVTDSGTGMSLDTILKKLLPPFEGGKSSDTLANLKNIIDDKKSEKILRINQFIAAIDMTTLSDTERLTIDDITRRLEDNSIDEMQRLDVIKNIVTFTGRFGIGFYSLLYFLKTDEDSIEVVTSTGRDAFRIRFFRLNGELQTAITVLNPGDISRGTTVSLESQSFNKNNAQEVINQFLRFNANAKISVSMDNAAPTVINEEVFNPGEFEHISDDTQVETFYSKAKNTSGKTTVYINVHGVTIMKKQVDGFGMPETVVFNFPANIGLPISRNKILVNEIFIEKAKDMIRLIASKPALLSAFFPCVEVLESSAKASYRNILANVATDAAYDSWRGDGSVYLPNEEEYSKIKHDGVVLVDRKLLRMVLLRGFANYYPLVGEPLIFASGEEAVIGNKQVYLVDFVDETKYAATNDAILINRKHAPKFDSDKALYNALLKLSKEGRFGYVYQPQALAVTGAGQGLGSESAGISAHAIAEDDPRVKRILDSLPDDGAKSHFEAIARNAPHSHSLKQYIENPTLFLTAYNTLVKSGLVNIFGDNWIKFYELIPWNYSLDAKKNILQVLSENERIRQLQEYFIDQGHPQIMMDLFVTLMNWSDSRWTEEECSQQVKHKALERLWDLREFLNDKTHKLIISAVLLDVDTYEIFRDRIKTDVKEISVLDDTCWTILNSHDPNYFYSSDTIPFQLFLKGDFKALRRMASIYNRLLTAYNNPYTRWYIDDLAISMHNMSDAEVERFIKSGGEIDVNSFDLRFLGGGLLLYYFRFFYQDEWEDKINFYLAMKNRGAEMLSMERILASDIPIQQKKKFLEAIIEEVNSSESEDRTSVRFPFDFDSTELSQIKNSALFVQFISQLSPFDAAFLHKKYSLEKQGEGVPLGYQYHLRYKNELLHKITIIFRYISDLPINEFNEVCNDFNGYFSQGKMTSRIEPYIQYLLNSQDAVDIAGEELDIQTQRNFTLVDLYDTFLELSSEEEAREESDGIKGDFSGVDNRLEKVAQKAETPARQLTEERRKLLRNTFRAAAQQSADDLVMIREVVQNVLDETPTGAVNQRVAINTYRKTLQTLEGEQELTVIDIEDTVGMNAERIYNKLLMPFSSSKKDPDKFLGKQGQGFFTLLANSEYVVIKTVRDGKVCILKLTPVRQNGQVVDFQVDEERRDAVTGENNGTHIQSFIRSALPGLEAARVGLAGQRFAALVDSNRLAVEVNGRQINLNKDRRIAVEKTQYGDVEFYSMPGESFMALGGLWVKPMDDELRDLVPPALKSVLLQHGFAINLPFQKIKRIQGGSDIANREEVYKGIKDAVALGAMKLVIAMFARGELPSLGLLGNDYYDWPYDQRAATDAQKLMDGSADINYIKTKYFSLDSTNQLAKLLLAIPLDFLKGIIGESISLAELFEKFKADPSFFNESIMAELPQPIKDAFKDIEEKERKKESQHEAAKELGVPEQLISNSFITLPEQQGEGMAAYWAFLAVSNNIARIGIEAMLQENSAETLGSLQKRLEYLRDNPTRSHYYAEANGLSMAHAQQGGRDYAWNLLEQRENLKLFYQYLNKQISLTEFLDKAFEDVIETLSHELIHILEESAEGTHNDVFLKRQRLMISAMVGARNQIAAVLADIRDNTLYANNLQDIQMKDFLDYAVRARTEISVDTGQVVIPTGSGLTVAEPDRAVPLLSTSKTGVDTSVSTDHLAMPVAPIAQANENIEDRQTTNVESLHSDPIPGRVVRIVVGQAKVDRDTRGHAIGEGRTYEKTAVGISKGLSDNRFSVLEYDSTSGKTVMDERKQVLTFDIETADQYQKHASDSDRAQVRQGAINAFIASVRNALQGLPQGGSVVAYVPQVADGIQLVEIENGRLIIASEIQEAFRSELESHQLIMFPDAYSDLNPENEQYPDYDGRVALGRHVTAYYRGDNTSLDRIRTQLQRLGENPDDILSIGRDGILLFLRALRIKAIDYESIRQWQISQEAVATAL